MVFDYLLLIHSCACALRVRTCAYALSETIDDIACVRDRDVLLQTCKQNFPFPSKLLRHEQSAKHIVLSQIMQAVEEKEGAELHQDLDIADVNMPEPSDLMT